MWTGLVWLKIGTGGGSCEFSIESSGSINCWETILLHVSVVRPSSGRKYIIP
jgi:hypothetical protein